MGPMYIRLHDVDKVLEMGEEDTMKMLKIHGVRPIPIKSRKGHFRFCRESVADVYEELFRQEFHRKAFK